MLASLCFQQKENEGSNLQWSKENRETKVVCVLCAFRAKTSASILAVQVRAALRASPPVPPMAIGIILHFYQGLLHVSQRKGAATSLADKGITPL